MGRRERDLSFTGLLSESLQPSDWARPEPEPAASFSLPHDSGVGPKYLSYHPLPLNVSAES